MFEQTQLPALYNSQSNFIGTRFLSGSVSSFTSPVSSNPDSSQTSQQSLPFSSFTLLSGLAGRSSTLDMSQQPSSFVNSKFRLLSVTSDRFLSFPFDSDFANISSPKPQYKAPSFAEFANSNQMLAIILLMMLVQQQEKLHKREIEDLQESNEENIQEINEDHENEINTLKTSQKEEFENLKKQHDIELDQLKNASKEELDSVKQRHQEELTRLTKEHNETIELLKSQNQQLLDERFQAAKKTMLGTTDEFLQSSYFTDQELKELTDSPNKHKSKIANAHDNKSELISNKRYNLQQLQDTFLDLKNILPTAYSNGPNKNYLLGEAQNNLDLANQLKEFKRSQCVGSDSEIDAMIERLMERARNYIKATQNLSSPIALDLNGDGKIGTISSQKGTQFDLDGDGKKEKISWINKDDGFLVLDRNGNRKIDDGRELFGNQHGAANGFEELAKYDSNNDGKIDKADQIWNKLKVWQDLNGDGISKASELKTLNKSGIKSINLRYSTEGRFIDDNGVDHKEQSTFEGPKGQGKAVDVWFELA